MPMTQRYFYPGEDLTPCLSYRCHESDDVSAKNFDNPQKKTPEGGRSHTFCYINLLYGHCIF